MPKTHFSSRCAILGELWLHYREDASHDHAWSQFFEWADVALPLSYMIWQNIAILDPDNSSEGAQFINDAWITFCEMIDIDSEGSYGTLEQCWNTSTHDRLPTVIKTEI